MTWYTKKHISLETLHRIHNCMISHVTQEGKNFTFVSVDKTQFTLKHQNKPSVDDAEWQEEKHSYINKKFLVYLLMMRMCMMIFYTFREMNNVVCVGL